MTGLWDSRGDGSLKSPGTVSRPKGGVSLMMIVVIAMMILVTRKVTWKAMPWSLQ